MEGTITSKGQITVPAEIRERLHLRQGDRVRFEVEDGIVKMSPKKKTLDDVINCLPKSKVSYTVEEMNEAIAQAVCDKYTDADAGTRH